MSDPKNAKAIHPMHLWANIHNVSASPHFRNMRVSSVAKDFHKDINELPDYKTLFGNQAYCECEECRSIFGPAAYFVDLMRTVDEKIETKNTIADAYKLKKRRPDLAKIQLTCENTNKPVSYLEIVNKILALQLTPPNENKPESQAIDKSYQTLATAEHAFILPFNRPLEQIRAYLRQTKTDLASVYKTFNVSENTVARETLGLSVEEYKLLIAAQTSENAVARETVEEYNRRITAQTAEIFGVEITPNSVDSVGGLEKVNVFLRQSGLSAQELRELFNQGLNKNEIESQAHGFYINSKLTGTDYHSINIGKNVIENLSSTSLDRIHRFIRLAKRLNWSFADLDWTLKSIKAPEINAQAINTLAEIKTLQTLLGAPVDVLCSFWHDIKTIGKGDAELSMALFDKVFGDRTIIGGSVDPNQVAHSLAIGVNELNAIANIFYVEEFTKPMEAAHPDVTPITDTFTLQRLSILYRHAKLAQLLKLPVIEYLLLLDITDNKKAVFNVNDVSAIAATADWMKTAGFSVYELHYLLKGADEKFFQKEKWDESVVEFLKILRTNKQPQKFDLKVNDILNWDRLASDYKTHFNSKSPDNVKAYNAYIAALAQAKNDFEFSSGEFSADKTVSRLCAEIEKSQYDIAVKSTKNSIEWLNELLQTPNLIDKIKAKKTSATLCSVITGLEKDTAELKTKAFDNLNAEQQKSIKRINRLLIESIYTAQTPKLSDQKLSDIETKAKLDFIQAINKTLQSEVFDILEVTNHQTYIDEINKLKAKSGLSQHQRLKLNRLQWELRFPDTIKHISEEWREGLVKQLSIFLGGTTEEMTALAELIAQIKKDDTIAPLSLNYIDAFLNTEGDNKNYIKDFMLKSHQWLILVRKLQLTPAEISGIQAYPKCFALQDNFSLRFDDIKTLSSFKQLINSFNDTEGKLLDFFKKVEPKHAIATPLKTIAESCADLSKITGWQQAQITRLNTQAKGNLVETLSRFKKAFDLTASLGIDINYVMRITKLADMDAKAGWAEYTAMADSVIRLVKAQIKDSEWQQLAKKLDGGINEQSRTALATAVLRKLKKEDVKNADNLRHLSEYLLIDVEMSACASVSYIKQAILSVQTYLQRCRMNLEPAVTKPDIPEAQWELLMEYRKWEASRKVFLYPENYLADAPRQERTKLFREFEDALLQSNITQDAVEAAYHKYFDGLVELSNLKIVETYRCRIQYPNRDDLVDTLFIFGRTATEPHGFYYRRCIEPTSDRPTWEPWLKLELSIKADTVSPVFAFNKLFVFWVETTETTETTSQNGNTTKTKKQTAAIKYSYQTLGGKWVHPQTLQKGIDAQDGRPFLQAMYLAEGVNKWLYHTSPTPRPIVVSFEGSDRRQICCPLRKITAQSDETDAILLSEYMDTSKITINCQPPITVDRFLLNQTIDGLISYWPLNQPGNLYDTVAGFTATLGNDAKWVNSPDVPYLLSNQVLEFTGNNAVVSNDFTSYKDKKLNALTVEVWVKLANINDIPGIIYWKDDPNITLAVAQGKVYFKSGVYPSTIKSEAVGQVQANQWTHLAFTWSRTTLGEVNIYINGKKYSINQDKDDWRWQLSGKLAFCAGKGGQLTEVRIYDKQLNADEIAFHAKHPISKKHLQHFVTNQSEWIVYGEAAQSYLLMPENARFDIPPNFACTLSNSGQLSLESAGQSSPLRDYWPMDTAGDLLSYWPFNNVIDGVTNPLLKLENIALIKKISDFPLLRVNKSDALEFTENNTDGKSNALQCSLGGNTLYSEFTLEVWVKFINISNNQQRIISSIPNNDTDYFSLWLDAKNIAFELYNTDIAFMDRCSDEILANQWVHLAVTWKQGLYPIVYINGKKQSYKKDSQSSLRNKNTGKGKITLDRGLIFGAAPKATDQNTTILRMASSNQMTELCIWRKAMDENQIIMHSLGLRSTQLTTGVTTALAQRAFIGGIDHLLTLTAQNTQEPASRLSATARPSLDFYGAYGVYFQEIFFHLPFLVANTLSAHRRYSEARNWYHYIFNPTLHSTSGKSDAWRYLPLRNHSAETLQQILSDEQAIRAYTNNPFDPHAIARLRIGAYEKAVVMKYIDNLIAWGDACFAKDTWESITQASTLYMLAYDLLGPKPESIGKCEVPEPKTYQTIGKGTQSTSLTRLHGKLKEKGKLATLSLQTEGSKLLAPAPVDSFLDDSSYFCVPENEQFTAYWKKVEDQLFKIRHCQNIKGVVRELALFEPPLNPAELVRAATAGGMSQGVSLDLPVPHYRFEYMLEKARTITATVIQLGASLLSVLEKKDAETLAVMRTNHESALLKLIKSTREQQVKEALANQDSLGKSLAAATQRLTYYKNLASQNLLPEESTAIDARDRANAEETIAGICNAIAAPLFAIPNIFGLADGGQSFGAAYQAVAGEASSFAGVLNGQASLAEINAQYKRRKDEWEQQAQMAQDDIELIRQQISAAKINVAIAESELQAHEKSLEQAQEIEDFLKSRFTTPELYQWMSGRLSSIYFETFKIALEMALLAQKAYQFESNTDESYIVFDYWDGLKQGLLGGEGLMLCLNQLEKAHTEGNARRLEIEKTISLKKLCANKFDDLKKGSLTFSLSEELFNNDFPQHYCRRIKTLSISIPAVVGPYENINATLIETGSKTRVKPGSDGADLKSDFQRKQKIALSRGINDSGMFELNFRDERYLPFEGTGAISDWELCIPKDNNPNLNYDSLTDVIIHLCYTALDGDQ